MIIGICVSHVNKLLLVSTPRLTSPITWLRHSRTDSPTSSVGGGVLEGSVRSSSWIVCSASNIGGGVRERFFPTGSKVVTPSACTLTTLSCYFYVYPCLSSVQGVLVERVSVSFLRARCIGGTCIRLFSVQGALVNRAPVLGTVYLSEGGTCSSSLYQPGE